VSLLNSLSTVNIYDDATATNNPQQRFIDWKRNVLSISVTNPSMSRVKLLPGQTLNIFTGAQATSIDNTSLFSIALNPYLTSTYRITNTSGTAPVFRTARTVAVSGVLVTIAINNNATATFTAGSAIFGAVQTGDTLFLPTTLTGDASLLSPFSVVNGGLWTIIGVSTTQLTAVRQTGVAFSGVAEAQTPITDTQFQVFSSDLVQVGSTVEISSGFSAVTRKAYVITAVTPSWIEFISTSALPLETGVAPTATGLVIYSKTKRFLRVEVDQQAVLRLNGDTGSSLRLDTITSSIGSQVGWFEKGPGPCWQLDVVNRSTTNPLNIVIMSAE
jgi:hypothetical protein